jgi:beta-glucosidase
MKNRYIIDWNKYAALARQAAAEGAVLLQNRDSVLPFQKGAKIALFGRSQLNYYKSGTGSGGMVNTRYVISILDALKEEKEIFVNESLEQVYRAWVKENPYDVGSGWGCEPWSQKEMPLTGDILQQAAACSDIAVVEIGRTAGEDQDASEEKGSYLLSDGEEEMLQQVCQSFDQVVVVLNVGNIIDMSWVKKYQPQAVLYTWQGGMEGGHAVADVLMGRVNPCGKLADTIAGSIADYPSSSDFGGETGNRYVEDIYVGYRYFETFAKDKVVYPFGYGLSYTKFEYRCTEITYVKDKCTDDKNAQGKLRIKVQIKNVGACAGKEVIQVYCKAPQGKLGKPLRALAAFGKTRNLQPHEMEEMVLEVTDYQMASYDDSGVTGNKSCYVMEAGIYEIYVGTDVRSARPAGDFELKETKVAAVCTSALAPVEKFQRMKPEGKFKGELESKTEGKLQGEFQGKSEGELQSMSETEDELAQGWEDVPLRNGSVTERMQQAVLPEIEYTGNKGYLLGDVYDGRISMETFVAQLDDEELCCITRGEGMCSPKVTPGTAAAFGGVTDSLRAYGIPCACCSDGPSGIRMDCGTYAFSMPNGTCLACTFDEKLMEELYQMEGAELRKNRIDTLLGPGMNIHRNPLNGRNFEYFSEDPLLTGKLAAAQLRGMNAYGVTGTIKHFAANNQEYHRRKYNSVMSERAAREIYLKGFETAVKEGGAYMIMSTYGAINGLWTASNYDLLTVILRGEWNFEGMVMTDWWADMNDEGGPATTTNASAMIRSQNDVYMVTSDAKSNTNKDNLEECLENGSLKREALVRSCINILKVIMRSPVMERRLGRMSAEEQEAYEQMPEDDRNDFDMQFYKIDEKLILDASEADTSRGQNLLYGIETTKNGSYEMRMKVRVDASELAQVSVSVFMNGTLKSTVTLNGTNGEYVEIRQDFGVLMQKYNYLKLYFAQSGMKLDKIEVELTEEKEHQW